MEFPFSSEIYHDYLGYHNSPGGGEGGVSVYLTNCQCATDTVSVSVSADISVSVSLSVSADTDFYIGR